MLSELAKSSNLDNGICLVTEDFFKFLDRNGSVIVDFVVHFNATGNATLLTKAGDVLKQSLNQSNNGSSFVGFDVDPNQASLKGKRVTECFINGWVVADI